MSEEKLREDIAIKIYKSNGLTKWGWCNDGTKEFYRKTAGNILSLIHQHYKQEDEHTSHLIDDVIKLEGELKELKLSTKTIEEVCEFGLSVHEAAIAQTKSEMKPLGVEAVKEILVQLVSLTLIDLSSGQPQGMVKEIDEKTHQICQLTPKIKLPENPYEGDIDFHQNIRLATRQGFAEALQQVKEELEKLGFEVE